MRDETRGSGAIWAQSISLQSRKEANEIAKRFQFKGGFKAKAVLRIWKMEKEIEIK